MKILLTPLFFILGLLLFMLYAALQAAPQTVVTPCIKWDVVPGFVVNKKQTERLYIEAFKWVQEIHPQVSVPCLNVRVGVPCPDATLLQGCWNLSTRTVYLPQWEPGSAASVYQATVYSALWNLVKREEVVSQAKRALDEDTRYFLDYVKP